MRFSTPLIAAAALTFISACSTVPKTKSLTDGIDADKIASHKTGMRASNDPVCTTFYGNVIQAANKSARARRNNAQMASAGASIATTLIGLGPVGSIATSSAARVLINGQIKDVSSTIFDPENKFDKRIIDSAKELNCPVRMKSASTP